MYGKCSKCGSDLNHDGSCPFCRQDVARVMDRKEEEAFDGVTIEDYSQTDQQRPDHFEEVYEERNQQQWRGNFRSYGGYSGAGRGPKVYSFSLGNGLSSWRSLKYKLLGGLIVGLIAAFLLFVALPVVAIGIFAAIVIGLVYNLLR